MHRTIAVVGALILSLFSGVASAQTAPAPKIDCESAKKPEVDFKTYWDTCRARAAAARARAGIVGAAAGDTIEGTRTTTSQVNWSAVPTWSDGDILAQFPLQRDVRYMTGTDNPGVSRRISWMYPDDGCFSRAEQFNVKVAAAGKPRPHKLFAFGSWLRVYTTNESTGTVYWGWHVVPVVKRTNGEPIVFDSALSPCRPLNWKKWLALMADDVNLFDTANSGFAVSLADPNGYFPSNLKNGEPSHSAESLTDQQTRFLNYEWSRQVELGRDPNVVLGATPPWSGYACVSPELEYANTITVPAGTTRTLTATCPFATLSVGGSQFNASAFKVTKSVKNGNGWQLDVRNTTGSSNTFGGTAICLTGAPTNAQVSSIQGNVVNVTPGSFGSSTASCSSGTLIGGGYQTTDGTSVMRVYENRRTTSSGSTWQASAQNTTGSTKSITAFAYCLPGTNFTFAQTSLPVNEWGIAFVMAHPKKVLGGGFYFPRTANYTPTDLYQYGPMIYVVNLAGVPSTGDPNARGYAETLVHP
jgi:hypothetical protein